MRRRLTQAYPVECGTSGKSCYSGVILTAIGRDPGSLHLL